MTTMDGDDSSSHHLQQFREQWLNELCVEKESEIQQEFYNSNLNQQDRTIEGNENIPQTEGDAQFYYMEFDHLNEADETTRILRKEIDNEKNDKKKACLLYQLGVRLERRHELSESIRYYRKAIQLYPDVEYEMKDCLIDDEKNLIEEKSNDGNVKEPSNEEDEEEDEEELHLYETLMNKIDELGNENSVFFQLPHHIQMMILKDLVGNVMDLNSILNFIKCSRRSCLLSFDEDLWKKIMYSNWRGRKDICKFLFYRSAKELRYVKLNELSKRHSVWKHCFVTQPRLRFRGVYFSRSSYIRQQTDGLLGMESLTELINYYRIFRFFPDGYVVMILANTRPKQLAFHFQNLLETYDLIEAVKTKEILSMKRLNEIESSIPGQHTVFVGQYQYEFDEKMDRKIFIQMKLFNANRMVEYCRVMAMKKKKKNNLKYLDSYNIRLTFDNEKKTNLHWINYIIQMERQMKDHIDLSGTKSLSFVQCEDFTPNLFANAK